ncbi:MAG: DUF5668 domain-containing protein, partial [Anaerolineae bacterium]|nr:DUF5668 domain-containing protein [Anaerolineae bacterium]
MNNKHEHNSLVGPSLLIGVGLLLLLDNLGYLSWNIWEITRLWPLLLIIWGLELLLEGRRFGRFLVAAVLLVVMVGGVWFMTSGFDHRPASTIT